MTCKTNDDQGSGEGGGGHSIIPLPIHLIQMDPRSCMCVSGFRVLGLVVGATLGRTKDSL